MVYAAVPLLDRLLVRPRANPAYIGSGDIFDVARLYRHNRLVIFPGPPGPPDDAMRRRLEGIRAYHLAGQPPVDLPMAQELSAALPVNLVLARSVDVVVTLP